MRKIAAFIVLLILTTFLTACSVENTSMDFSFNASIPYDYTDEKVFCFNENHETAILNASLQIDTGNILMEVFGTDNEVVFSNTYESSGEYKIELENVTAKDEYKLKISTEQTKNVTLKITSPLKLIKDIENSEINKPEKPIA